MKRLFLFLAVMLTAAGVNAQVTWNVTAGGGLISDSEEGTKGCFRLNVQSNIPLGTSGKFTFSPSVGLATDFEDLIHLDLPLMFGTKIVLGSGNLFFPKVGPVVGMELDSETTIFGPGAELAVEIKHFVVALSGYYSLIEGDKESKSYYYHGDDHFSVFNVALTLGYKF